MIQKGGRTNCYDVGDQYWNGFLLRVIRKLEDVLPPFESLVKEFESLTPFQKMCVDTLVKGIGHAFLMTDQRSKAATQALSKFNLQFA